MEGVQDIQDMVTAVKPKGLHWAMKGDAQDAGEGRVEAWLSFETELMKCVGHVRLNADGTCWTLLTAADELRPGGAAQRSVPWGTGEGMAL
eukprot:Skav227699  [mRNA]  locus=scaffold1635:45998:48561:+ [translate_table: standard]